MDELGKEGRRQGPLLIKTQTKIECTVGVTPEFLVGGYPSVTSASKAPTPSIFSCPGNLLLRNWPCVRKSEEIRVGQETD